MKEQYNMIKEIKRLKSIRGSGTELVSIYVPAGFQLSEEVAKLKEEHSQSGNIKSKQTRSNVQGAIDKILQYLKLFKTTPKNGIAVFAGNTSDNQSKSLIELFSIEPPLPLKVNIYRCDSTFLLEPIQDMIDAKDMFALLVMDGREATVATLKGSTVRVFKKLNSTAHAKVHKGGQSAARYERSIEESIGEYHTRTGEAVNALFQQNDFKIKGLIVGGPGPAKEGFVKSNSLNYQVKVLGVYDVGYTDEFGLQELVEKASELLKEQEAAQERKILERFMQEISRGGLAVSGYMQTKLNLEKKKIQTLIINRDLSVFKETRKNDAIEKIIDIYYEDDDRIRYLVGFEDKTPEKPDPDIARILQENDLKSSSGRINAYKEICSKYNELVETKDAIETLVNIADEGGVEIVFVSSESSYGKEFMMGFRGIGALLRYK